MGSSPVVLPVVSVSSELSITDKPVSAYSIPDKAGGKYLLGARTHDPVLQNILFDPNMNFEHT